MYASLLLSSFLTMAAPVPEFKLTAEEEAALKALEPFGFKASDRFIDNEFPYGTVLEYRPNLGYDRLRGKIIRAAKPTQNDLAPLAKLRRSRRLIFQIVPGGDATLDLLRGMDRLEYLDLSFAKVTDEGVKKLIVLKRLKTLELNETSITDASLKVLAEHPSLRCLGVIKTRVTDEGLKALEKNEKIVSLNLGGNGDVTDAGLISLGKMPNLDFLVLLGTRVTDKGLARLAHPGAFPKMAYLYLRGLPITDDGLKPLLDPKAVPALKRLGLANTEVSDEMIKALKKARPELEFFRQ